MHREVVVFPNNAGVLVSLGWNTVSEKPLKMSGDSDEACIAVDQRIHI